MLLLTTVNSCVAIETYDHVATVLKQLNGAQK